MIAAKRAQIFDHKQKSSCGEMPVRLFDFFFYFINSNQLLIPEGRLRSRQIRHHHRVCYEIEESRNCIPRILKFARGPYPRQESVPSSNITIPMNTVDFLRLQCSSSSNVETALSVSAIELVTAANSTNKKNTIPIAVPNPMFAKTSGS